jgi:hypothetical protein
MRLRVELTNSKRVKTVLVDPLDTASVTNAKREVCAWLTYSCEVARASQACVGFGVGVHHQDGNCDHDVAVPS